MTREKRKLLDLFCGAGGAAMGYARAGFEVVGVDIDPQPRYPFEFVQADALAFPLDGFDVIHASPPCQRFSQATKRWEGRREIHPDLVEYMRVRFAVEAPEALYVIENVEGAPLRDPLRLCGSSFGLDVRRHRLFESNVPLVAPPCNHDLHTPRFSVPDKRKKTLSAVVPVYGNANYAGETELRGRAMGIDWMTSRELSEAIPPAYTEFVGRQVWLHLHAQMGLAA